MKVILYTNNCPKCNILEEKLKAKNIQFEIVTDIKKMIELGMMSAPHLSVDEEIMDFSTANNWINNQEVIIGH